VVLQLWPLLVFGLKENNINNIYIIEEIFNLIIFIFILFHILFNLLYIYIYIIKELKSIKI